MTTTPDTPQIRIPPPLIYSLFLLAGLGLHRLYPIPFVTTSARWVLMTFFLGAGILLLLHCFVRFKQSKTNIEPWKPTFTIIMSGAYRYSRNPVYLSFFLIGLGVAFGANSLWLCLILFPFLMVIHFKVVLKEERYLEQKFGEAYMAYKNQVRRWL